jgi:hypothetical protein
MSLEIAIDYTIDFSDTAVTLIFTVSTDRSKDEILDFVSAVKQRIIILATERYPILFEQPEANRVHDFYINLSNFLDSAKLYQMPNNDYQISVNCDF